MIVALGTGAISDDLSYVSIEFDALVIYIVDIIFWILRTTTFAYFRI